MKTQFTRDNLKEKLLFFYSITGTNLILRGERRPSYEKLFVLNKEHNIPFDIWIDIKSYLNNTKKETTEASA